MIAARLRTPQCLQPAMAASIVAEHVPTRLADLEERERELVRDLGRLVKSIPQWENG